MLVGPCDNKVVTMVRIRFLVGLACGCFLKYLSATSFPGSLFSASIVVEKTTTTMEAEKRDPGNEVDLSGLCA